jgi:metallophosphoesterase (TIGR03767 family)
MRILRPALVLASTVVLVFAASGLADPLGKTTVQETIVKDAGSGYVGLSAGPGEAYRVRSAGFGSAKKGRAARRRSLVFFGQLTDPQIADEMSPLRAEFADPAGRPIESAWRPSETLLTQVFDQTVRNMNANSRSLVRQGNGNRARLALVLTTGDMADNQQLNETRWFLTDLNGGTLDPFSGKAVGPDNPCSQGSAEQIAQLNAAVAARSYTGVQDYNDYPGRVEARYADFWNPDASPPGGAGPFATFPRYPGLLDRAQKPFQAQGLIVPWLISRGNHDGLIQGNIPASNSLLRPLATTCVKPLPYNEFDPHSVTGVQFFARVVGDPAFQGEILSHAGLTPPDPDRRIIGKAEYKRLAGHGFQKVDPKENAASKGTASYYASTTKGVRFISLDTVAEGGGASGNLDDSQYKWLERELRKTKRNHQLAVVFGHHSLGTMNNTANDEAAGACAAGEDVGCDVDPRKSTPIHLGRSGSKNVRDLLLRYPNVVALVVGHTHRNEVLPFRARSGRSGFWQINTASHADSPQQSREIEILNNRDGTLSIFGTILEHAAPIAPPAPGTPASSLTDSQLGSLGRILAANDPQRDILASDSAVPTDPRGKRQDRNVELIVRDPR